MNFLRGKGGTYALHLVNHSSQYWGSIMKLVLVSSCAQLSAEILSPPYYSTVYHGSFKAEKFPSFPHVHETFNMKVQDGTILIWI